MNLKHEKFYQLLGLCNKTGGLVSGEMACEKAIKTKKTKLVIISEDASSNTLDKFIRQCINAKVAYIIAGCKELLGRSIGKSSRTVIAINDERFSNMILEQFGNQEHQYGGD